jgi:adenylate cyclase
LSGERVERRLAAILAADVAGYSRLMGQDEAGTLARLRTHRRELIDLAVAEHKGRIVKTTGDGILIEFPSVVEAVACAIAVQRGMAERNSETPENERIVFRVGINLGDIIVEDGDIHGDGVNVAARLEGIAEPGEICISGTVRDHIGGRLDLALDDLGDRSLKNIARAIRVYRVRASNAPNRTPKPTSPALALPDKPSIAVLPFQNMSGDPEQEYFADGMVEEIITALSRIRWLFVIARNSSFTYKGQAIDVTRVGRELGVRYVLEGSVRKGGGRVRITAQLIEAETGTHLWADRFDGSLEDVFDLQDEVATAAAAVIEPTLQAAEARRASTRPTADLTAYDLYLRGVAVFYAFTRDSIREALDLLNEAIRRDPQYGPALAFAAICHMRLVWDGWSEEPDDDRTAGLDLAQSALEVAGSDPVTLANAAYALAMLGEDVDAAIATTDRALALNPGYARGWYLSGQLRMHAGQFDTAIDHLRQAMRLSPRDRTGAPLAALAFAQFYRRQFDAAAATFLADLQEHPNRPVALRGLAACYAHLGRLADAAEIIRRLKAMTPEVMPRLTAQRDPAQLELFLSGLRLAMGETA